MAAANEIQENIGRILKKLQPIIGKLPNKQVQDRELRRILTSLGIGGETSVWRKRLGNVASKNGHRGSGIQDVFTRRVEEFLPDAYLERLDFERDVAGTQQSSVPVVQESSDDEASATDTVQQDSGANGQLSAHSPPSAKFAQQNKTQQSPEHHRAADQIPPSRSKDGGPLLPRKRALESSPERQPKRIKQDAPATESTHETQKAASKIDPQTPEVLPPPSNTNDPARNNPGAATDTGPSPDIPHGKGLSSKRKRADSGEPEFKSKRLRLAANDVSTNTARTSNPAEASNTSNVELDPNIALGQQIDRANSGKGTAELIEKSDQPIPQGNQNTQAHSGHTEPTRDLEAELNDARARIEQLEEQLNDVREQFKKSKPVGKGTQVSAQQTQAAKNPEQEIAALRAENQRLRRQTTVTENAIIAGDFETDKMSNTSLLRRYAVKDAKANHYSRGAIQGHRAAIEGDVASGMGKIYKLIDSLSKQYIDMRDMDFGRRVELSICDDTSASPQQKKLETLYARVLGPDWKEAWLRTLQADESRQFRAYHFLSGLIGSAVYEWVFSSVTPWDWETAVKNALGERYKHAETLGESFQIEESLRFAQYLMFQDEAFRDSVMQHAKKLSSELVHTLMPHMEVWHAHEERSGGQVNIPSDPERQCNWMAELDDIFYHALLCKGLADTFDHGAWQKSVFEFFWLKPGVEVDPETAISPHGRRAWHQQKVRMTLWPGVKEVLTGSLNFHRPDVSNILTPVRVLSDEMEEQTATETASGEASKRG